VEGVNFVGMAVIGVGCADCRRYPPIGPLGCGQCVEQIEQAGVEMTYLTGTMVAEIAIELGQRIRQVIFAAAVNDIEPLIGMGVIKTTPVFDRGFDSRL